MPKFCCFRTIIIPVFNVDTKLKRCLDSLVCQKYADFEVLLINDGSTDGTSETCKQNKVKEVVHPYSKGNGAAIKSGARAATGEILIFMDGDGQHDPATIPVLIDAWQHFGAPRKRRQ